jgi:CBS domain containing-hemolysin-like protein
LARVSPSASSTQCEGREYAAAAPLAGTVHAKDGWQFEIVDPHNRRIEKVRIRRIGEA